MTDVPKAGDCYCCESCGMKIEVKSDCGCEAGATFECCGAELKKDAPEEAKKAKGRKK